MAKFATLYERFCRMILTVFVVNVAILVHTVMGFVIIGLFPSIAAANATYRIWLLEDDRSWKVRQTWAVFHREWKASLAKSQPIGYLQLGLGLLLAYDYWVVNWNLRTGMAGLAVSGVLVVIIVAFLLFCAVSWVMFVHFKESLWWILRTSLGMVVARPLCSLMLLAVFFLIGWVCVQWPGVFVGFGLSLTIFSAQAVVYSFGHLPGFAARQREEGPAPENGLTQKKEDM
ncbi:hypothetical protein HMPREF0620_0489 [Parascardovia denticolens DSM 10105 = JCM 12538]|uniref:DUF624 domain-containing protein n=1 Tax=Parascardovia denticolens DSM 10105 = JCM 12538 TaxID=864564 RepID=E6K103_PARDN|nr:DUF624 domain-containing protein [Parascardovia denticolens]EFG33099.1 hypothetical protein HMPREF9017_00508 [Parascardovia denticolens F0305]EFT83484.1 hypothetical protein HMPREF0620_0489 [Parascardovia denticolens DSM 10105 = JCM 12538]BAR05629.1 conserved hypothetical protein [Parascardovia denticolens DSM 10105 = JCM 12538]